DFIVTFKNNIWRADKKSDGNLEEAVLDFCATPRTRAELEHFTGFSRYYMMHTVRPSALLFTLREGREGECISTLASNHRYLSKLIGSSF
ncbi:MAG: hypothetical protein IIX55_08895, partial [Muribaculaceae bacterium]|nr:hypothetical protein [Muribaculaceae bacterium]